MATEFKCIEGWSKIVNWGGARLRENGHSEEFFAAVAVAILGGPIHIQKGKRLQVTDPHGIRAFGDN